MKNILITICFFSTFLLIFIIYAFFSAHIYLKTEKEYYFHNELVSVYIPDKHQKLKDKEESSELKFEIRSTKFRISDLISSPDI